MNIASRRFLAFGIAAGVLGKPRAKQTVHVSCTSFRGGGQVWPVRALVINDEYPEGAYFAVYRQATLDALKTGGSTEGLEPWEPEEGEEV